MSKQIKDLFHIQKVLEESGYYDTNRISKEIYTYSTENNIPIENILERIKSQEPWEYIKGYTTFCNNKIIVNKNTLIPRIETEQLVEIAKNLIKKNNYKNIIDIGTGSGCIIISLAKIFREEKAYIATDISKEALDIAQKNATLNNIKHINFTNTNLLENINIKDNTLIVANLPYIPENIYNNLDKSVKDFEPKNALVAGKDGMLYYNKLIKQIDGYCNTHKIENISLLIEIDPSIKEHLPKDALITKDYRELERFALLCLC